MSVFNRMSDIINANLNAMLEKAEDPEKMVRMITREMEETLVEVRSASASNLADKKHLEQQLAYLKRQVSDWESRAELAITKGRDDLARAAIAERCNAEQAVVNAQADLIHLEHAIAKLKTDTDQLEDKLSQARMREKALILRGKTAQSRMKVKRQINNPRYEDSLLKFESYERRLDEMEGQLESWELGNTTLKDEINSLERDSRLDEELAALKSRVHSSQVAVTKSNDAIRAQ